MEKSETENESSKGIFTKLTDHSNHSKCVKNTRMCFQFDHAVRLLVGAMENSGCKFNPDRHLSCEPCINSVSGGYDASVNQAIICQNHSPLQNDVCDTIAHELIHMYDYCRADMDYSNLDHLACTEIRAANLVNCNFISTKINSKITFNDMATSHQNCVRQRAMVSMVTTRNITPERAMDSIDRVFTRCFNDLEPFGRVPNRLFRRRKDGWLMANDGYHFGYTNRPGFQMPSLENLE